MITLQTLPATLIGLGALLFVGSPETPPAATPALHERVWLAGGYDDDHVVMYFGTAHFGDSVPASARKIRPPRATGFLDPAEISVTDLERFRDTADAERFAVGDRYELLLDSGHVATITLTSLVAFVSDEQVGNDSYVGAIGIVAASDRPWFTRDYYAVRPPGTGGSHASTVGIERDPPSAPSPAEVASYLRSRMAADPDTAVRNGARMGTMSVSDVTTLSLGRGMRRYYARGTLRTRQKDECTKIEAWLAPSPRAPGFELTAKALSSCSYDWPKRAPGLLNVVDLGAGRVGVIAEFLGTDGRSLTLYEYNDRTTLAQMRVLQTIGVGE